MVPFNWVNGIDNYSPVQCRFRESPSRVAMASIHIINDASWQSGSVGANRWLADLLAVIRSVSAAGNVDYTGLRRLTGRLGQKGHRNFFAYGEFPVFCVSSIFRLATASMKYFIYLLVFLLIAAHQDFWYWEDATLVWGFLPIGLWYHTLISIGAAIVWLLACLLVWPKDADLLDPVGASTETEGN